MITFNYFSALKKIRAVGEVMFRLQKKNKDIRFC